MKSNTLIAVLFIAALLIARALSGAGPVVAFWSPVSPVAGCEGIEDPMQYAQCCMQQHPDDWSDLCPDGAIPDPVHESPVFSSPLERPAAPPTRPEPPKTAHRYHRDEPAHGVYTPPLCWGVSPGRQLCVWEGIWSAQ